MRTIVHKKIFSGNIVTLRNALIIKEVYYIEKQ
jgi:hypothetical protein